MLRTQYMKLPKGIQVEGVDDPNEWVLELKKNLHGGKDAGRNWYIFLKGKLEDIGFVRSNFDECVFFKGTCMYVLYTDDSILAGSKSWIRSLQTSRAQGWKSRTRVTSQTFWE